MFTEEYWRGFLKLIYAQKRNAVRQRGADGLSLRLPRRDARMELRLRILLGSRRRHDARLAELSARLRNRVRSQATVLPFPERYR